MPTILFAGAVNLSTAPTNMDKSSPLTYASPMFAFYLRAWWPMWSAAFVFAAAPLLMLAPEFTALAIAFAVGFGLIGFFAATFVVAAADHSP